MKVLTGHLTETNKKVIKMMLSNSWSVASTKKESYKLTEKSNIYTVVISKKDRGLIPCAGSQLRTSNYTSIFTL